MGSLGLVDSHLHLADYRAETDVSVVIAESVEAGVTHLVCNGTSEADWGKVLELSHAHSQVIPCFGLHPWFVNERSEDWIATLESFIESVQCGFGEMGLDKLAEPYDSDAQEIVFRAQLELAWKHERPAMIHCVKAWGPMMDVLRSEPRLPDRMLFHAYGGSADLVQPLADVGAYFSFSGTVVNENFKKAREALRTVPLDRLLLETDAPNMLPLESFRERVVTNSDGTEHNHPANLPRILQGVADLLGMPADELKEQVWENSVRFFGQIRDL